MPVRLGCNPIIWSNDDLRTLGGDTPLETCLSEARAAGYEGIELGHKFPREAATLKAALAAHGLSLVSGWYSSTLLLRDSTAELARMRSHLDLLKTFGCGVVIVCEGTGAVHDQRDKPLSTRPVMDENRWSRFTRRLNHLAAATAAEGIQLAYHHHMGTVVQTTTEIDRLMNETNSEVKLLLDTGHLTFAGADPVDVARKYAGRIAHVHLKDIRGGVMQDALRHDWSFLDSVVNGVFTVPDDGDIDFSAVLRSVAPYDGWLVVEAEQDPAKAPPSRYARLGAEVVQRLVRECGLT